MIYFSICTRGDYKSNKTLQSLLTFSNNAHYHSYPMVSMAYDVAVDAKSIYEGHKSNLAKVDLEDDDIVVFVHDDVEILSTPNKFSKFIEIAKKPSVGFVGVAGATKFDNGAWWTARNSKETRGFVWQGSEDTTMSPNYFGDSGQVVVLDGCLMAATYKVVKAVGLEQPDYLSSGWDFYDIHLSLTAHLKGFSNFVVPIQIRHESSGEMREGWYKSKEEFLKKWRSDLPCRIPANKTVGLP